MKKEITTDKALVFSAAMLIIYTIICIIQEFMGITPDSTLTGCFFIAFGVAEGGFCTAIQISKKRNKKKEEDDESIWYCNHNSIYSWIYYYFCDSNVVFEQKKVEVKYELHWVIITDFDAGSSSRSIC